MREFLGIFFLAFLPLAGMACVTVGEDLQEERPLLVVDNHSWNRVTVYSFSFRIGVCESMRTCRFRLRHGAIQNDVIALKYREFTWEHNSYRYMPQALASRGPWMLRIENFPSHSALFPAWAADEGS